MNFTTKSTNNTPFEQDQFEGIKNKINRHKTRLYTLGVVTIVIFTAIFIHKNIRQSSEKKAQAEMFPAVFLFEKHNYAQAISGNESCIGLIDISKKYPQTKASNLANFYIGISYLHLAEYDKCIEFLKKVSFKDYIMQAKAYGLVGDAYLEKEDYKSAIQYYQNAATHNPNKYYAPLYIEKAAIAYEMTGDPANALKLYENIYEKYPDYDTTNIVKNIARLKTINQN